MWEDFRKFLEKANVVGLAQAVIVGGAAGAVVKSMTDSLLMPIVGAALPDGGWRAYTLDIGPIELGIGDFAGAFVNFAIISFIAWQIGKIFIKPDPPAPPGSPHQGVPVLPEHRPGRRDPLRPLHVAAAGSVRMREGGDRHRRSPPSRIMPIRRAPRS